MRSLLHIGKLPPYIGNTPLLKIEAFRKSIGVGSLEIYLKWEGNNPTGTHKDRAAYLHTINAYNGGYDSITTATCGNYGVAISYFSSRLNIKPIVFIPKNYNSTRIHEIKSYNAEVKFIDGTYEDAVKMSVEFASNGNVYDANPGGINDVTSINAYKKISYEIVKELSETPSLVSVPVGNGTTLVGIYAGFRELYDKGYSEKIPIIIGGTTKYGNQIYHSWAKGSLNPIHMDENQITETFVNEPLVAYESMNAREALKALNDTNGTIFGFEDIDFLQMHDTLWRVEGVSALPASTASLLALLTYIKIKKHHLDDGIAVSIITGGDRIG